MRRPDRMETLGLAVLHVVAHVQGCKPVHDRGPSGRCLPWCLACALDLIRDEVGTDDLHWLLLTGQRRRAAVPTGEPPARRVAAAVMAAAAYLEVQGSAARVAVGAGAGDSQPQRTDGGGG